MGSRSTVLTSGPGAGVVDRTLRLEAPLEYADDREHRRLIAVRANGSLSKDGTDAMVAPLRLKEYTVATLPTASIWTYALIYVTDETGGAQPAFSDGTNWRRLTDRAVVS